jgi:hypothetical protein
MYAMKMTLSILQVTLLLSLLLVPSGLRAQDQDKLKDRIIKNVWEAMYGELSPDDLQTLYFESYFHGREVPGKIYVKRPNQFRNESEGITLIFDGEHAAIIDGSKADKGEAGGISLVDSAFLSHFEVDIALAFPAFFEYPSEYRGKVQVGTSDCWELFVGLPHGGHLSYFIDTSSYLVIRRLVSWDGDPEQELWENIISGYHEYKGILFESGYSFKGHEGQEEGFFRNAKFNLDLDDALFRVPEK